MQMIAFFLSFGSKKSSDFGTPKFVGRGFYTAFGMNLCRAFYGALCRPYVRSAALSVGFEWPFGK